MQQAGGPSPQINAAGCVGRLAPRGTPRRRRQRNARRGGARRWPADAGGGQGGGGGVGASNGSKARADLLMQLGGSAADAASTARRRATCCPYMAAALAMQAKLQSLPCPCLWPPRSSSSPQTAYVRQAALQEWSRGDTVRTRLQEGRLEQRRKPAVAAAARAAPAALPLSPAPRQQAGDSRPPCHRC